MKKLFYWTLLLIFPSMVIELLSGSTPPINFFNPVVMVFFSIAYGLPFILLRELKIRWHLSYQILFLAPIIGIFIEGIFMQSFFNPAHEDLGILAGLGLYFGVQWPWTIYLIFMHALFSFIIPLFIIDFFFPTYRQVCLLSHKKTMVSLILIVLLTGLQWVTIYTGTQPMYEFYNVDLIRTMICLIIIFMLIFFAYRFKDMPLSKGGSYKKKHRILRHIYGFLFMSLLTIATFFFAEINLLLLIISQLLLILFFVRYVLKHIYREQSTQADLLPYLTGFIFFQAMMAIFQEYHILPNPDNASGMSLVGQIFILIILTMNLWIRIKPSRQPPISPN